MSGKRRTKLSNVNTTSFDNVFNTIILNYKKPQKLSKIPTMEFLAVFVYGRLTIREISAFQY